jgi:uncharacterized protein YabN with tetrapyrrole methylase and pyrophosphatase domain
MNEFEKTKTTIRKIVNECPWGKEQTLEKHIEELKLELEELKEAFEKNDLEELRGELGDVFYDSLFLLMLAEKENGMNIEEIIKQVREKVERRKPYVFGDMKVDTKEEALRIWNEIKQKEKEQNK